jgi:hypothetical protein
MTWTDLKWRFSRRIENAQIWVSFHLPAWMKKWALVQAANKACEKYNAAPGEVTYEQMYKAL